MPELLEAGGSISGDELASLYADSGAPLGDVHRRWCDGLAVGQMVEIYYQASQTDHRGASRRGFLMFDAD